MGRIQLDRPISFLSRRFALIVSAGALLSGCGGPTKPTVINPPPTDPPQIACPTVSTASSPDGNPIPVAYADPTITGGQQPFNLSCTPVSGASYPIGTTTVTCAVTDAQQRTSNCTFAVTVVKPAPPRVSATKYVAFGDSITWGEDGRSLVAPELWSPRARNYPSLQVGLTQTYPNVLQALLAGRYTTQSFRVDNAGQKGEAVTDSTTLGRFSSWLAGGRYEAVLIMEGANDLADRDAAIEPQVIAGLRQMILDARSRGVRPFLATIPPEHHGCCPDRGLAASLVPGFNDRVRDLARQEGATLVDVYDALLPNESVYIGFDGLHPTVEGYAKIAETFFTAIKQTLEVPSTTTVRLKAGTTAR